MKILIIGGTRNLGHQLVLALLADGQTVTVLNRGKTRDELPPEVERLRADRKDAEAMQAALKGRSFDAVVDFALFNETDAQSSLDLLNGRCGHYIFISTGQVYLVREGLERPFSESDYAGRLLPAPKPNTFGYEEWLYGFQKRQAEDIIRAGWESSGFPFTSLRLPMVNSERDHFNRLYAYILRIRDGGPILIPETPQYPLRHVYGGDAVKAIHLLLQTGKGKGEAYNISQDETVDLKEEFIPLLSDILGHPTPAMVEVKRSLLEANGFLPDCSPFSERWMSELTNDLSKSAFGMVYTPLRQYLENIVAYYDAHPPKEPASYRRRHSERNLSF
jgi:nucleoside-diphosphate-sugar epimerase